MVRCSNCGRESPDEASFCAACGARLAAPGTVREERKVVTVVYADLVGSTARGESLDPEDVRAVLAPYHARLRTELERYGGTVEKFIGDAVVAVFGAPRAHEDDPERAGEHELLLLPADECRSARPSEIDAEAGARLQCAPRGYRLRLPLRLNRVGVRVLDRPLGCPVRLLADENTVRRRRGL